MKTLLTTIMLVSCIGGGTASAYLTNKTNENNEIKITTPKKANKQDPRDFEIYATYKKHVSANDNNNNMFINSQRAEFEAIHTALMFKGETITQTRYDNNLNQGEIKNVYINNYENNPFTNILNKWQITPYYPLVNVQEETKLIINLDIDYSSLITNIEQEHVILKLKITTLQSVENWSIYMNETNYYTQQRNSVIMNTIKDPQNQQNYTENVNIISVDLYKNNPNRYTNLTIQQELTLLRPIYNQNTTNYIFTYIEPYTENLSYGNYLKLDNNENYWASIPYGNNAIKISGTMIPNISNYEVIDIPYIMFNILTMPFAFISTAFNLTLFPGTPYQINISNLFLTIIAIFIFIYIIKIIFKR